MIDNWEEINSRYNSIKDHKPRATKKLKELGEILASAYRLDPQRADEMWQYIIELNINDNITFAKFYIAQVFKKLTTYLTLEEATQLVSIHPERVRLMLIYGYDSVMRLSHAAYAIMGYQVFSGKLDEAVDILKLLEEKFITQDELNYDVLYSVFNAFCECLENKTRPVIEHSFRYDIPLDNVISFYDVCCRDLSDEYMQAVIQVRRCLLTGEINRDIEETKRILHCLTEIAAKKTFEFNYLVKEYLYAEREIIGSDAESILYHYYSEANIIYLPISSNSEDEKLLEKSNWYQDIIINSQRIISELFRKTRFNDFHEQIMHNYMYKCDWKNFLQLLVLGLNQENEPYSSSYLKFIKKEIRDYLLIKDEQIECRHGHWSIITEPKKIEYSENSISCSISVSWSPISKPRVTKENVNSFIQALGRACILTHSSPVNEQLIDEVRSFVTKETGNVDVLLSLGMEVEADNRTELEKFSDYAKKESIHRSLYDNTYTQKSIQYFIKVEQETKISGVDTGKLLAKRPEILSFLFLHDAHSSYIKKYIILGALLDNNFPAALKCVDYLIKTATYPNFSDSNSWASEMTTTLCDILQSVYQRNTTEPDKPYPESVTLTVIQIVEKCLPYLGDDDANEVKGNLVCLKPTDDKKDEFIGQLLQDVEKYTVQKKPKEYSKQLNNTMIKIKRGIGVLSKLNRIDIVAQVLRMITADKNFSINSYESWLTQLWPLSNKQLYELYYMIPDVYASYIEESDSKSALNLLRSFGKLGNPTIYKALKSQILQKHGYIDGMNSCFHYSVETSRPIFLCKNKVFAVSFLYWNITSYNYRTGIESAEVVLQIKNHSKEYISLFATDISINGIPLADLRKLGENDTSEQECISYYVGTGEVKTERLVLRWNTNKNIIIKEIRELSFSIIAQKYEKDIAREGAFAIIYNSNDDTFAIKE